jgi:hypothetical protein
MKTALILLLGNRDVQIPKELVEEIKNKIAKHLVSNNEGAKEYLVINKSKDSHLSFLDTSKLFFEELDYLYPFLDYPMLNSTLEILSQKDSSIDKIVLTTSKQSLPHSQDSFYFAEIISHHLNKKGYECELKLCDSNPNDFPRMVEFYSNLFDEVSIDYKQIVISNSGGTPTMRSASHFAGIFRGFDFITINSSDEANLETFKKQEEIVLRNIAKSMLKVFDYEGVLQLPISNTKIKALANYALARIALNFKLANKEIEEFSHVPIFNDLFKELDKKFTIRDLEREMYFSAKIKYHQRSYADYLWRLFTIHDNIYIPILEEYLDGKIIYNKKSNFQEWKDLLEKYPGLTEYLSSKTINSKPLGWEYPNKFVYQAIYDFVCPKDSKNRNILLDKLDKILNQLSPLRNTIAHSYSQDENKNLEGIGIEEMEKALPKKFTLDEFNSLLSNHIGEEWEDFGVYSKINAELLKAI